MQYNFDTVVERKNTDSEKYDGLKKFAPGAPVGSIPLWIADMDFKTAPGIVKAMHERVDQGIFGYTDVYNDDYQKTVCRWMEKRHGWKINPEDIVVDSGVVPAISHGLALMADRGNGVIIHIPSYKPFYDCIIKAGMIPVCSDLNLNQGRYTIDFEDLEEKARDKNNKILLISSPHNPTGRVWTIEELTEMMRICREHDLNIISDEIHCDILRSGIQFIPMAKLFPGEKRLITCTSPSKTFNLAGNHQANIIISDMDLKEEWIKQFHYLPNPISVEAVKAAYKTGEPWLEELNVYLEQTFHQMHQYFSENMEKVHFSIPEATYLAWIDMREMELPHQEMVRRFIDHGLIIEGGEQFVGNGTGFIRMNVAMPHSVIAGVLEKIKYIFN